MAPVTHCSVGDISLFPRTAFIPWKDIQLTRYNVSGKYPTRLISYPQRRLLLHQSSSGLFQFHRSGCSSKHGSRFQIVTAVGTNVTVEESSPAVSGEDADETSKTPPNPVETTARSKRPRTVRKSEMPPLKEEELLPGASFTGKVRSIQPFGVFVDIGAYTNGLVHVSRLSDGYVKDISSVVSVGQEVTVRLLEASKETGRISLSMRDSDDPSKTQQRKDAPPSGSGDKPRPVRKNAARSNQKTSKFVKGQVLDGTVKNLNRAGAYVSLPDGEEGFLPLSEESEGFGALLGNSSLQVGQEVNVRVLRITKGMATLTMKKEEVRGSNLEVNHGVVYAATNPFELAFRRNKDIAGFLDERERAQKASEKIGGKVDGNITKSSTLEVSSASGIVLEDDKTIPEELHEEISVADSVSTGLISNGEESVESSPQNADAVLESLPDDKSSEENEEVLTSDSLVSDQVTVSDRVNETDDTTITEDEASSKTLSTDTIGSSAESIEVVDSVLIEESNSDIRSSGEIDDQILSSKGLVPVEVSSSQSEGALGNEVVMETPPLLENEVASSDTMDVKVNGPEEPSPEQGEVVMETPPLLENEVASSDTMDVKVNGPEELSPEQGEAIKATISPALVKQLREETGAGMMDCKKALAETGGNIIKAQEFLRKKGLASADKKASRATAEGRVGSYIHDNRIGVLIEVNCETDFVSRGEIFKQLVDDLAMQVAACPQVRYLAMEDVPEEIVSKERDIEMQKEDLLSKPEQMRSRIVDGRIKKRLEEFALLEQPYIKNDKMVVKDLVKQTIATIGENIKVKRFARYNLGEGLQRKSQDFAAEVAAQAAASPSPAASKDQSVETKDTVEKPPVIAVSASLVKQLREETGAGMMDCKKALTETGGDLEKAQEYLRKKGLSSADKKSSRLAAEGRISAYIHDSRIGVLIEVNCETDFVARNERFRELVDDLAMQVAACPQVEFVSVDDIPDGLVGKEKEIEMQREDLRSKPEHIREKIVEGRISKRLGELALLEQPFIKDDSVVVKDLVKQTVAALGENVRVRRFVRYTLGECQD